MGNSFFLVMIRSITLWSDNKINIITLLGVMIRLNYMFVFAYVRVYA